MRGPRFETHSIHNLFLFIVSDLIVVHSECNFGHFPVAHKQTDIFTIFLLLCVTDIMVANHVRNGF